MDNPSSSIGEMVAEIAARMPLLNAERRRMFIHWLQAHHHSPCITEASLTHCLTARFARVPADALNWEYQLVLSEISWWRDLDERSLAEFMMSESPLIF